MNSKDLLWLSHSLTSYVVGGEGNTSTILDDSTFLVKASGTSLSTLSKKDLVKCDLESYQLQLNNFNKRPSIEASFHAWLLKQANINFIAHTHPINTLKILCSGSTEKFSEIRLFPDQVVFNGKKSCLVDYANPGIELLELIKRKVSDFSNKEGYFPKLILLKNHGIICPAETAKECLISTQMCEKSAEIFVGSINLGNQTFLTNHIIDSLDSRLDEKFRREVLK